MNARAKYLTWFALLAVLMLVAAPARAASFDVAFYELTEQMTFDGITRTGAGSLAGSARAGSALCPALLVTFQLVQAGAPCYVEATGHDTIDALSGAGELHAHVQVAIQGDNPVDAPEFVVLTGALDGTLQVTDPDGRLIAIGGTFVPETVLVPVPNGDGSYSLVPMPAGSFGLVSSDFAGTVRLPFVLGADGKARKARRGEAAKYLGDDGRPIPVRREEYSLGRATARFELNFQ